MSTIRSYCALRNCNQCQASKTTELWGTEGPWNKWSTRMEHSDLRLPLWLEYVGIRISLYKIELYIIIYDYIWLVDIIYDIILYYISLYMNNYTILIFLVAKIWPLYPAVMAPMMPRHLTSPDASVAASRSRLIVQHPFPLRSFQALLHFIPVPNQVRPRRAHDTWLSQNPKWNSSYSAMGFQWESKIRNFLDSSPSFLPREVRSSFAEAQASAPKSLPQKWVQITNSDTWFMDSL